MSDTPYSTRPRVAVLQEGDRFDYAIPIALQRAGILERVFTDWYTRTGSIESAATQLMHLCKSDRAKWMTHRFSDELDPAKVRSKPTLLLSKWWQGRSTKTEIESQASRSEAIGKWVLEQGLGEANALLGDVRFVSPSLCSTAKSYGLKVITEQSTAPCGLEHAEAAKQLAKFPAWSHEKSAASGHLLAEIEEGTWESSDVVTCMSDYTRAGLLAGGVPAEKIVVVPFPVSRVAPIDRRTRRGPVTVGFVGPISLRNGAPYFFDVARRLDPAKVRFVMVGPVEIDGEMLTQHRDEVELPDPTQQKAAGWMEQFDIFLFPTTFDGSAAAVATAMMAGLPVVTTRNAGSMVQQGIDGFICPYDDVDRMAHCIQVLASDPELRHQMGAAGRACVEPYDVDSYGRKMAELFEGLLNSATAD